MSVTFGHAWLTPHRIAIVPVHQEPLPGPGAAGWFSSQADIPPDATRAADRAALLDQFEPVVRAKSVALALDVQILALPTK